MKKLTSIMLALLISISCAATVFAAQTDKKKSGVETVNLETAVGNGNYGLKMLEKYPEAINYIASELRDNYSKYLGGSSIDVSRFNIPDDDAVDIYRAVVNEFTELVHVNPTRIRRSYDNGITTGFRPVFLFNTVDEVEAAFKAVNKRVKSFTAEVKDEWDDLHKARYLHDMLATQVEYTDTSDVIEHSAYGALVNSKAVCQGYSHAYGLLLKTCGVDSTIVTSSSMTHEWNMVKIGENYYHVDVTWDDPTEDDRGYVEHTYFMLSDSAFSSDEQHYDWNAVDANDTTYDSAWWKDVTRVIYYIDGKEYYIKKGDGVKGFLTERDENSGEETTLYTINNYWMVKTGDYAGQGYYWTNCYSQLAYYDGYFYFNTPDSICKIALGDETPETVFTVENEYDIYGLNITFDSYLNYDIKPDVATKGTVYSYDLKSGINRLLDTKLEIDENDTNYSAFGITKPEEDYTGLNLLGIQKKSDEEETSMRFVSIISSEVLKNVKEYGYVFTTTSKETASAKELASKLTVENGHKYDCTDTINSMTGDWGSSDLDTTSYKYVTAAINNITGGKAIVARLYVIDNDGLAHYGTYIDSNNNKWQGCAARLSDLD